MKQYEYLVAYIFTQEGYLTPCTGTSQVLRKKKIDSWEDIKEVQNLLSSRIEGASNLGIFNFILLGRK